MGKDTEEKKGVCKGVESKIQKKGSSTDLFRNARLFLTLIINIVINILGKKNT